MTKVNFALLCSIALVLLSLAAPARIMRSEATSRLDKALTSGFAALSKGNFSEARVGFEDAALINSKDTAASDWLFTKIALPDEDPDDLLNPDTATITRYRRSMGTKQSLLIFLAFSYQLEGDSVKANKYFDAVYKMQSVVWGYSWRTFIPLATGLYYASVPRVKSENFGRFLFDAGRLMRSADKDEIGLKMILEAQTLAPKSAAISAFLAGTYVTLGDAANTRKYAQLSLDVDPKQNRVLIDYATGDWLAGDLSAAVKHANESISLDSGMPGPYATLAFVALEKGDLLAAKKNAEIGVKLSAGHAYHQTVLAAVLAAQGKASEARNLIFKAYAPSLPDEAGLRRWFFRSKPLDYVLQTIKSK